MVVQSRFSWPMVSFPLTLLLGLCAASLGAETDVEPQFLNFSSPAPYIFSSLSGLLQQWSNTFFENGHSIAPCEVPKHTLLYHGRHDTDPVPSPEWLAFDMEMSYAIMGSMRSSRLLTYRTTKNVRCIYFDGMSASLMGSGTESQMTFLYGDSDKVPKRPWPQPPGHGGPPHRPPPRDGGNGPQEPGPHPQPPIDQTIEDGPHWNPLEDEYFRARGLCDWIKERGLGGVGWGYEGIVRMNAGFEMIWCDFNSTTLKLVSNIDVSAPLLSSTKESIVTLQSSEGSQIRLSRLEDSRHTLDEGPHGPGMADIREPFRDIAQYIWFSAAARRYGSQLGVVNGGGESRIRIDTCGLFMFYDTGLHDQSVARVQQEQNTLNMSQHGQWLGPRSKNDSQAIALQQLSRRRRSHRANHVTESDGSKMYELVESGLKQSFDGSKCSGTPWDTIAKEVTTFYAPNLRALQRALSALSDPEQSQEREKELLQQVRFLTHWLMTPHFEYPPGPYTPDSIARDFSMNTTYALQGMHRCRSQYTPDELAELHVNERLLSWAIDYTFDVTCSLVFRVGLAVEQEWLLHYNTLETSSPVANSTSSTTLALARVWLNELEELMAWLGWVDQWTGCENGCAAHETCYIPIWPVGGMRWGHDYEPDLWSPKCVNMSHYPPE